MAPPTYLQPGALSDLNASDSADYAAIYTWRRRVDGLRWPRVTSSTPLGYTKILNLYNANIGFNQPAMDAQVLAQEYSRAKVLMTMLVNNNRVNREAADVASILAEAEINNAAMILMWMRDGG